MELNEQFCQKRSFWSLLRLYDEKRGKKKHKSWSIGHQNCQTSAYTQQLALPSRKWLKQCTFSSCQLVSVFENIFKNMGEYSIVFWSFFRVSHVFFLNKILFYDHNKWFKISKKYKIETILVSDISGTKIFFQLTFLWILNDSLYAQNEILFKIKRKTREKMTKKTVFNSHVFL